MLNYSHNDYCCSLELFFLFLLLVFLRGVLGNVAFSGWFFDGENVVKCVVKRGGKTASAWALKIFRFFQLYFWVSPGVMGGGSEKQISPLRRSQERERLRSK